MARKVLAVIVGYIVMAAFVFITFTVAYLVMGADGAFAEGSYEISGAWLVVSIVLGIIAALLGGLTCQAIGKSTHVSMVLAGIVLVLGIAMAIPALSQDAPTGPRTGDVGVMDAMQVARPPVWLPFLNAVIGAVGVIIGSRMKKS